MTKNDIEMQEQTVACRKEAYEQAEAKLVRLNK